jgi:hypothetical protein
VFPWLPLEARLAAITVRAVALDGKTTLLLSPEILTQLLLVVHHILFASLLWQDLLEVVVLAAHLLVMVAVMVETVHAPALVAMGAAEVQVAIQVMVEMAGHNPAMLV